MPWTEENRKKQSDLMKSQNRDPDFVAKKLAGIKSPVTRAKIAATCMARSPISTLTPDQLEQYRFLRKQQRYTAAEALAAVTGGQS